MNPVDIKNGITDQADLLNEVSGIGFSLTPLYEQGFFSHLDFYFARSMKDLFVETDSIVIASCALASRLLTRGHVCVDLERMSGTCQDVDDTGAMVFRYPDMNSWVTALNASAMVSTRSDAPMVLDSENRLYLSRYFDFQNRLTANICARLSQPAESVDPVKLEQLLGRIFSRHTKGDEQQKQAVKNALLNHFSIITGGPGTGKTFVTRAIKQICLKMAAAQKREEPIIICAAPTGKAASRMEKGRTIHAVLKPKSHGTGFQFHRDNLLQADMVIIDESSMIDMVLLTRLLEAIPLTARIVLIGDSHQLASVQAGSVFSDICRTSTMEPHIHELVYNFRSRGKSGIEALATAINKNDPDTVEKILAGPGSGDVTFIQPDNEQSIETVITPYVVDGYGPMQNTEGRAALGLLDSFRILSAHNSGEYGTLQINHLCEKILRSLGNFDISKRLYKKIIMVKFNDYHKELFNGDTGLVFESDRGHTATFLTVDNLVRTFRVTDLPQHDTAFCITVHKSQGSEFGTVLLVIPDRLSPVVTRQLLYTGVTRAKDRVIILGQMAVIKAALAQDTTRHSGIASRLEKTLAK